ncbi:putative fatty acyl-CoA reductase CG5065 [Chrysoperla carnea]|uniref:putative fatty acyl-CoA reductase CG5065 n=1 Tax=Chrysoperla carnea TaxID=189513 RepID=UPI001D082EAA|nr:putative fatty acyl-CoA reductase CG5065 [Chrysoperla carnea]
MIYKMSHIQEENNNIVKSKKSVFVENVTLSQLPKNAPSICEFYADQNILITGGTGFMGKVLIEKLLRSCPKIKGIYLLLRSKKNYTDEQRLSKLLDIPLFERLRNEFPQSLSKLKVIKGDVSEIEFGLSGSDMKFIINEINIVFHVAASVRFDDPLREAILINTRGTREMLRILKQMQNLKVFLHTSTTYCNVDKDVDAIEEKVYKATTNWETMINAAENMDTNVLNFLEQKILNKYPNTYTFSKNLSEELVSENCGGIPTVIFRPTVVVGSDKEPIPGWVDSFNGPMGLVAGVQVGILHTVYIDGDKKLDWVPVDVAINGMIVSAWYKALEQSERNKCLIINSSTADFVKFENKSMFEDGLRIENAKNPPSQLLWYPFCFYTPNKYFYWFYFVTLQLIPAIFLIFYSNMKLAPFTLNEFKFKNDNFKSLHAMLKLEDMDKFSVDYSTIEIQDRFATLVDGSVKYLLKGKSHTKETLDERLSNFQMKFYLHVGLMCFLMICSLFIMNFWAGKFLYKRYI